MAKTIFNFRPLSDTALNSTGNNILTKLTGNADFADPNPDLATLEAHLLEYNTALADAALGDRRMVEIKNEKRRQLEQTLQELAAYVEHTAKRSVPLILSAGFEVTKTGVSTSAGPRSKPIDVNVIPGPHGSGTAELRVKRDRLARYYRYEYRLVGDTDWAVAQSSRSRLKLTGLQPAQIYEFRAAYLGTDPMVTYSDVVTAYAG